jgi:hypothetical protein
MPISVKYIYIKIYQLNIYVVYLFKYNDNPLSLEISNPRKCEYFLLGSVVSLRWLYISRNM